MTLKKASVLVEMTGAILDAGDKLIKMANHADRLMDIAPKAVRATRKALRARKDLTDLETEEKTGYSDAEAALSDHENEPIDADFDEIGDEDEENDQSYYDEEGNEL